MSHGALRVSRVQGRFAVLAALGALAFPALSFAQYTPNSVLSAYGFTSLPSTVNGSGQTIAILDFGDEPTIQTDLSDFDSEFGFSAPPSFKVENENGSTTSLPSAGSTSDQQETALDVEFAHSVAPGANIVLIELPTTSQLSDLTTAATTAETQASVVSMSIGFQPTGSYEQTEDPYFNHAGVAFTAAVGDHGDQNYPGTSPYVVSVGGTSLTINNRVQSGDIPGTTLPNYVGGTYGGETVWNDSYGSSGGGIDPNESQPLGQQGAKGVVGTSRNVPDVAYDADPNTGEYDVYNGAIYEEGGTSIGAPQWAGLLALADQLRTTDGLGDLSSTQALQLLYAAYANPTLYGELFHDVTTGSNSAGDTATTGYDDVSGLGSPNASALVEYLGTTPVPEPCAAGVLLGLAWAMRRRRCSAGSGPVGISV